jgi:MbtH protein
MVLRDWSDSSTYRVVVNREQMYSIWPADRETPSGWRDVGKVGPKEACLTYIEEVWTDVRSTSLRLKIEEAAERIRKDAGLR